MRLVKKIEKARNVLENLMTELYSEFAVDEDREGKMHAWRSVFTAKEAAYFASSAAFSAMTEVAEYLKGAKK